jgi:hypothetical protein
MTLESFRPIYVKYPPVEYENPFQDQDLSFLMSEREQSVANFTKEFNRTHSPEVDKFEERLKGILR